jgi:hypothetical protein
LSYLSDYVFIEVVAQPRFGGGVNGEIDECKRGEKARYAE